MIGYANVKNSLFTFGDKDGKIGEALLQRQVPQYVEISKFPGTTRDLAVVVKQDVPAQQLLARREGLIGRPAVDACELSDLGHAESLRAVLGQQLAGRFEDRHACFVRRRGDHHLLVHAAIPWTGTPVNS